MIELAEINAINKSANEVMEIIEQHLTKANPKDKIIRQKVTNIKSATLAALDIKKIRELAASATHFEPIFEKIAEEGKVESNKINIGSLNEEYVAFINQYPGLSEQEKNDLQLLGQAHINEELENEC